MKLRLCEVIGELVLWHWQHDVDGHPKGGRLPGCYQVGTGGRAAEEVRAACLGAGFGLECLSLSTDQWRDVF
ncbi:MAG: hypothetical protein WBE58_23820 [Verrucomicrobiales bacterium]